MIYIILIFQAVTTYLDNKSNMFDFFQQTSKGKVASAFTDRGKILFISRNTFFVVPPLLGYLILNLSIDTFRNLILIVLFMNFLMTLLHAIMYFRVLKITKKVFKSKIYHLIFKLDFYLGIVAFMFFLSTPYILNYLAFCFPDESLWIVQLNPILNTFLAIYVIFIFEPRVAKKIDSKENLIVEFIEASSTRVIGRFLILAFFSFNFLII